MLLTYIEYKLVHSLGIKPLTLPYHKLLFESCCTFQGDTEILFFYKLLIFRCVCQPALNRIPAEDTWRRRGAMCRLSDVTQAHVQRARARQ